MAVENTVTIEYVLGGAEARPERHCVRLDATTLALQVPLRETLPEWTRLGFRQCPNCPLDPAKEERCPVAVALVDVVESFKNRVSHEVVAVTVTTPHRSYSKRVSLQEVVGSLMGLHMASAGCPILDVLRPLVATHLPFSTADETVFRTVSMYLLAQHLRQRRGLSPDWTLQGLVTTCQDVAQVNLAFGQRLLSINTLDASLNALVNLDCFAGLTGLSISENDLDDLAGLFSAYLNVP